MAVRVTLEANLGHRQEGQRYGHSQEWLCYGGFEV